MTKTNAQAWKILRQAETDELAMSMAVERAACNNRTTPTTPGDYLFWLEDEAEIQAAVHEIEYAAWLEQTATELRGLGISPAVPGRQPL